MRSLFRARDAENHPQGKFEEFNLGNAISSDLYLEFILIAKMN